MSGYNTMKKIICTITISMIVIALASCQSEQDSTPTEPTEYIESPEDIELPLVIFSSNDFSGSGNCATCHSNLSDSAGNDVSMDAHWRSTMMANAAKDPLWQAKVASEVIRNPHLKEVIEDKCATCHMPMAYTQANTDGLSTLIFDEGFLNQSNPLHKVAMDGNSCTLCHQIVDPVLGKYSIDTSTEPPDRIIYGPFANPQKSTMRMSSKFTPVYTAEISKSVLCGTCH